MRGLVWIFVVVIVLAIAGFAYLATADLPAPTVRVEQTLDEKALRAPVAP